MARKGAKARAAEAVAAVAEAGPASATVDRASRRVNAKTVAAGKTA
jgi:hypothetical protein